MVYRANNKKQSKNHHIFLFIVLALAICAAIFIALVVLNPLDGSKPTKENQETNNSSSSTEQKSESSDVKKEEPKEENSTEPTPEAEKKNTQYEGEDPNKLDSLTGAISFAGASDGNFMVNVVIDQAIGSSGRCNYTFTHSSGVTLVGNVSTEAGPSSSVCVYSTPATNVQSGNWKITVKVTVDNKEGIISGEANV
ncbi:hypothetical protein J6D24_03485 [Candidatus Saccharibacteria bacterium]|nr:hypothetical protein [Candidatus Saccharibacteria bacterium]